MSQAGKYLRKVEGGYAHWCPGCEEMHVFTTEGKNASGAGWTFGGDLEKPSFHPSIKITIAGGRMTRCHYVLTAGVISFCDDCTHGMVGKKVPLPELPAGIRGGA